LQWLLHSLLPGRACLPHMSLHFRRLHAARSAATLSPACLSFSSSPFERKDMGGTRQTEVAGGSGTRFCNIREQPAKTTTPHRRLRRLVRCAALCAWKRRIVGTLKQRRAGTAGGLPAPLVKTCHVPPVRHAYFVSQEDSPSAFGWRRVVEDDVNLRACLLNAPSLPPCSAHVLKRRCHLLLAASNCLLWKLAYRAAA